MSGKEAVGTRRLEGGVKLFRAKRRLTSNYGIIQPSSGSKPARSAIERRRIWSVST